MGGLFDTPHGIMCGRLLAAATEINIKKLNQKNDDISKKYLEKYAIIGKLLVTPNSHFDQSGEFLNHTEKYNTILIQTLHEWTKQLELPKLNEYG